jgi:hypothetical protein
MTDWRKSSAMNNSVVPAVKCVIRGNLALSTKEDGRVLMPAVPPA